MKKSIKTKIWLFLGLVFIGYYIIESLFVGFTFSLLWLWGAAGAVCLLCSALTSKFGKLPLPRWLFVPICVLLSIILAFFCVLEGFVLSQMGAEGEDGLDYIVVLGARVNRGGVPSKPLYWRIDAAEEYLRENPNTKAILSGGQGADEPISEAQCMFDTLTARGIDESRLIMENSSTNTNENIRYSLALMEEGATFGVVTNNFHVFRAVRIAEKVSGQKVSGIASRYLDALLIHYMARESVGILKDTLQGNMNLFAR